MANAERPSRSLFLPDFCSARAVAEILVIAELVAMVLTMAGGLSVNADVLRDFLANSLFMLWLALTATAALCLVSRRLGHLDARQSYLVCYLLLLLATLAVSVASVIVDEVLQLGLIGAEQGLAFTGRNLCISAIVSAVVLRYFHVQYQWRHQVQRETNLRIEALQARIRPHFLFNSLNTIAALIEAAPESAEQAVEDLADLFRASLGDANTLVSLDEEIALARLYQRLEEKRLGNRLRVDWHISAADGQQLPRLTLQPLLENAIHHGIEKLAEGGTVTVTGERIDDAYRLVIRNPLAAGAGESRGFRIALDNTRQRLALTLGHRATLATRRSAGYFEAEIRLPPSET
ncbi:MAG TPA: histidine kinase [Gammaproteobacteria bacterium]|nr:histidine kinase [Gammaproteobacteria bacterium]